MVKRGVSFLTPTSEPDPGGPEPSEAALVSRESSAADTRASPHSDSVRSPVSPCAGLAREGGGYASSFGGAPGRRPSRHITSPPLAPSGLTDLSMYDSDGSSSESGTPAAPGGCCRGGAYHIVTHPLCEFAIVLLIVANCVTLAMDEPLAGRSSGHSVLVRDRWYPLDVLELIFTLCFTAEMLLKIAAFGFCGYIRSGWNTVDFIVIIANIAALFASLNFSAFRSMRILKALLMVERLPGLKAVIKTVLRSLNALANLALIFFFILVIHSICAVQLWTGSWLGRCAQNGTITVAPEWAGQLCSKQAPREAGFLARLINGRNCPRPLECVEVGNPNRGVSSFDNFGAALLVMFECVMISGWTDAAYRTADAWGHLSLYFYIQLIGSATYVVLALAIIVMKDAYKRHRSDAAAGQAKGRTQRKGAPGSYVSTVSSLHTRSPTLSVLSSAENSPPTALHSPTRAHTDELVMPFFPTDYSAKLAKNYSATTLGEEGRGRLFRISRFFYKLVVTNAKFDKATIFLIVVNLIVMMLEHHDQPEWLTVFSETSNLVISVFFCVELAIKTFVERWLYFKDPFNVVDFAVVVCAIVDFCLSAAGGFRSFTALRALRLLRIVRVLRINEDMKRQFEGAYGAAQRVGFLMLLILILTFTLAVIGMHTFGGKLEGTDFDTFFKSVLTVFRVLTGDQWTPAMHDCIRYAGPASVLYFVLGVLCGNVLMMKLVLAIVMQHYEGIYHIRMPKKLVRTIDRGRADQQRMQMHQSARAATSKMRRLAARGATSSGLTAGRLRAKTNMQVQLHIPREYKSRPELEQAWLRGLRSGNTDARDQRRRSAWHGARARRGSADAVDAPDAKQLAVAFERGCQHARSLKEKVPQGRPMFGSLSGKLISPDGLLGGAAYAAAEHASIPQDMLTNNDERSLFLFGPQSVVRTQTTLLIRDKAFNWAMSALIALSLVALALGKTIPGSFYVDVTITTCFGLEAAVKILALGFVLGHEAYLRDGWNVLDFLIVLLSLASFLPIGSGDLRLVKMFRALRALRPLRLLKRWEGVSNVAIALVRCIPGLITVFCFVLIVFILFGVVGVQMFAGKLYSCSVSAIKTKAECHGEHWMSAMDAAGVPIGLIVTGNNVSLLEPTRTATAIVAGPGGVTLTAPIAPADAMTLSVLVQGRWLNSAFNFDNVVHAMLTLMVVASLDHWQDIMQLGMGVVGTEHAPVAYHSPWYSMFFLFFIVAVNFFIFSIFISQVVMTYLVVRRELEHTSRYSVRELSYFYMMKLLLLMRPSYNMQPRKSRSARLCYYITTHGSHFERFISFAIVINIIFMAVEHHNMTQNVRNVLFISDHAFTFLFLVEAALKLWALGLSYFKDFWNRFDFALVASASAEFVILLMNDHDQIPINPVLLRCLRAFLKTRKAQRLLRLVRTQRGIMLLFETLVVSLSTLAANLLFFVVVLGMYAFLGHNLFSTIRRNGALNHSANFEDLWATSVTLLRVATGDNWIAVMRACMVTWPHCSEDGVDCGFPILAPIYFFSFKLLSYIVLVNLFVATVNENFTAMRALSGMPEGMDELRLFEKKWSELFSNQLLIPTRELPRLLATLGAACKKDDGDGGGKDGKGTDDASAESGNPGCCARVMSALADTDRQKCPKCHIPPNYRRRDVLDITRKYRMLDHRGKLHFSEVLLEVAFHTVRETGEGINEQEWWSFESAWHQQVPALQRLPVTRWVWRRWTAHEHFACVFIQQWWRFLRRIIKLRRLLLIDVCSFRYLHDDRHALFSPLDRPQSPGRERATSFAIARAETPGGRKRPRRLSEVERRIQAKVERLTGTGIPPEVAFLFGWGEVPRSMSPRSSRSPGSPLGRSFQSSSTSPGASPARSLQRLTRPVLSALREQSLAAGEGGGQADLRQNTLPLGALEVALPLALGPAAAEGRPEDCTSEGSASAARLVLMSKPAPQIFARRASGLPSDGSRPVSREPSVGAPNPIVSSAPAPAAPGAEPEVAAGGARSDARANGGLLARRAPPEAVRLLSPGVLSQPDPSELCTPLLDAAPGPAVVSGEPAALPPPPLLRSPPQYSPPSVIARAPGSAASTFSAAPLANGVVSPQLPPEQAAAHPLCPPPLAATPPQTVALLSQQCPKPPPPPPPRPPEPPPRQPGESQPAGRSQVTAAKGQYAVSADELGRRLELLALSPGATSRRHKAAVPNGTSDRGQPHAAPNGDLLPPAPRQQAAAGKCAPPTSILLALAAERLSGRSGAAPATGGQPSATSSL
eukprot:TRINITY_DN5749_c0_g1_i2.p1 TRINITY_DN5749_c0_g1~~TRINITY_DN5749_c0_g1_i2.p1  ORF type:complete len:2293 (+),score=547.53 TRINITY_DN5749_c0_g1_i2:115-6879(+)